MKKQNFIYWASTGIFSLMTLFSAYRYLTAPEIEIAFQHLGFPNYFRIELAIAKWLGVLVLLFSHIPKGVKQFAYSGFTINLISASIAHYSKEDPMYSIVTPLVFLGLLIVSYIYYNKLNDV